jgi:hypothetical protein
MSVFDFVDSRLRLRVAGSCVCFVLDCVCITSVRVSGCIWVFASTDSVARSDKLADAETQRKTFLELKAQQRANKAKYVFLCNAEVTLVVLRGMHVPAQCVSAWHACLRSHVDAIGDVSLWTLFIMQTGLKEAYNNPSLAKTAVRITVPEAGCRGENIADMYICLGICPCSPFCSYCV